MSSVALRQLIARQPEARALIAALETALGAPVAVEDAEGRLLHGRPGPGAPASARFPVTSGEASLGWVSGAEPAGAIAALLTHLVSREAERKALGAEVLHLYREVNLIYSFTEKLAALLDLDRVAALTLQEARQLIAATDGAILLLEEEGDQMRTVAGFGREMPTLGGFRRGHGIVGGVAASGIGEIVNDVDQDPRRTVAHTAMKALLAAPLRVGEKVIGVILLGSTGPMAYTAAELKLLNTLALQTATAIENARLFERTIQAARERERLLALHQQAELARAKLEGEMKVAARIQRDLFPSTLPAIAGYECAARNRSARQCGGDYYDALQEHGAGGGQVLFCVADVSGKGLPAALVMSNMQATLRALLERVPSLTVLAELASELLFGSTAPEKYVTAAFLRLTPDTGALDFVGAGHLDNLIVRAGGGTTRLASTGLPLGLLAAGQPYQEIGQTLGPGDVAVLFSDGVTDAQNEAGDEFGEERLLDVLHAAVGCPMSVLLDRVFGAIDQFVGDAPQFDDITMLAVRRLPPSESTPA